MCIFVTQYQTGLWHIEKAHFAYSGSVDTSQLAIVNVKSE